MKKIRVAVIFGGTNTEHEVSLISAKGIIENLDKAKYDIVPIKITKENSWITPEEQVFDSFYDVSKHNQIDVVFPVLHGPYGEDGTIQGMLELMRLPYVGCNVLSSALCMDKVVQKQLTASVGIPATPYMWFTKYQWETKDFDIVGSAEELGYPLFVKPANQGSSVGVTKAHNQAELLEGIKIALSRDLKVIIEAGVKNAREIECAVLGNDQPEASVLGEIIPGNEFYDFDAKYIDDNSEAVIPAKLAKEVSDQIRTTAISAFKILNCAGLARVDYLLNDKTGEYYLNELNTMPGFTPISMYPKLWEATGISYPKLLDKLIELALERSQAKSTLNHSR